MQMSSHSLVDVNDSVLVVIDAQTAFIGKAGVDAERIVVPRIAWLVQVAARLRVPIIATEEEASGNGPTAAAIADHFPAGTPRLDKVIFGLASQDDILETVAATNRKTIVLVGFDTDVCVLHSAFGLVERGYRALVVTDATGAPGPHHQAGLERLRAAGIAQVSCRGLYYEWLRTLENTYRFSKESGIERPPGLE